MEFVLPLPGFVLPLKFVQFDCYNTTTINTATINTTTINTKHNNSTTDSVMANQVMRVNQSQVSSSRSVSGFSGLGGAGGFSEKEELGELWLEGGVPGPGCQLLWDQ